MKSKLIKTSITLIILFVILGCFAYRVMWSKIPLFMPKTIIKYEDRIISTNMGDHNWVPKNGGSSYITAGSYGVGLETPAFTAKPGAVIHIRYSSKPLGMKIFHWISNDKTNIYKTFEGKKDYDVSLPTEKGEYIFDVFANWDNNYHNTSTIFRVRIE